MRRIPRDPVRFDAFNSYTAFESAISSVQLRVARNTSCLTRDIFWTSLNPNMAAFLELYRQTLAG